MNFEQSISPLTEFLIANGFSVTHMDQHVIHYSTDSTIINVAYVSLEYLFYTQVGQPSKSLVELTPIAVREVFKDDSFQLQSALTIEDLIFFLKSSGRPIVSGDKKIMEELAAFPYFEIIQFLPSLPFRTSNYSVLKLFTGLVIAALIAW